MASGERKDGYTSPAPGQSNDVTADLVKLMPRDLVFVMRFLGESQYRLQSHFQDFIRARLDEKGVSQDSHPMIQLFIESHAILLRDFVFNGVSLSRQFRVGEIERMAAGAKGGGNGESAAMLQVDIWDQLRSHIETAEKHFRSQVGGLPELLKAFEKQQEAST